jgi:retron-type reverse transcriptase
MKKIYNSNMMSEITSSSVMDEAFTNVYKARLKDHANSDIWRLSLAWSLYKHRLREQLLSGTYQLSPLSVYFNHDGEYVSRYCSKDAVVLKAISIVMGQVINTGITNKVCYHLKGNGGLKRAVIDVSHNIQNIKKMNEYNFVIKSDIANFYESMDHKIVMEHCEKIIKDKRILTIINQYLNRLEICDGQYNLISRGIPRGCSLSPLIGAIILKSLDKIAGHKFFYVRYMDDWVILTKTRWQLRRLVKLMHITISKLNFKLALDKTYIWKMQKGFDFLGYRFSKQGIVGLAEKTIENFLERVARLYEQDASDQCIRNYVRRWICWTKAGLSKVQD